MHIGYFQIRLLIRSRVLASLCLLMSLLGTPLLADGILRNGVGAISTGRGGTNLGFADNGNVILDNPGALVNVEGRGLAELDLDVFFPDFSYSDPQNGWTSAANNPFPMGQLSLIQKSSDGLFAWGIGAFSHAGFSTGYELNGPVPLVGPQHYKSLGALLRVLPSLSVALTPNWTVGGTLGVAVSHTEIEGPHFTQYPSPFQGTPTLLDLQGTGAGLSWSVGSQVLLTSQTVLGASFQAETHIDADGSARMFIPGMGQSAFDLELETQWPSTLGIGLAHYIRPQTVVSTDVIWTQWSKSKQAYNLLLSNPTNPVFQAVLGNSIPERFPLQWSDSVAVRVGVQHSLCNCQTLRAGYVYHPNVIPAETLTPYIQAIVQHSLSCGYGWRVGDYGVDLAYQLMFGPDQQVAASDFVGGDFDDSESSVAAHWLLTSVTRRF
jgi:long-chain fatty acid transport protein